MELVPVIIEAMKEQQEIYDQTFNQQQEVIAALMREINALNKEMTLKGSIARPDIK